MRRVVVFLGVLVLLLSLFGSVALAEASCTCSKQPDGSTWCTCVGDDGRMYCETCPANGGTCTRVSCDG